MCVCVFGEHREHRHATQLNYAKINEPVVEQTNVDAKDTNKYVRL